MGNTDLDIIASGSVTAGFNVVNSTSLTLTIPSRSMSAHQDLGVVVDGYLTMPRTSLMPVGRIQIVGGTVVSSAVYYAFFGHTVIIDGGVGLSFTSRQDSAGRKISVIMFNTTAGAKTYAGSTANLYANLYSYPWS